jgi:predicted transcriptional regulator
MITREEELEAQALHARGWSISKIARHLGIDRKTVRAYLNGERAPGQRARSTPEVFEPFAGYVAQRLADDRHVWATTLFDELVELGYSGSYSSMTAAIRVRGLRPPCPGCAAGQHRQSGIIDHHRVRKLNGTGSSCRNRRRCGGWTGMRICWSARWRIRRGSAAGWRSGRTSRT